MAGPGQRAADLEHLRGLADSTLTDLARRYGRSVEELTDYLCCIRIVRKEREIAAATETDRSN